MGVREGAVNGGEKRGFLEIKCCTNCSTCLLDCLDVPYNISGVEDGGDVIHKS